jgi:carnosine N-methyltransferase
MSHDRSSGIDVSDEHKGQWGSVITCFFIDTARNIIDYLQTIYELLDDAGVWINIGPLLWHFENVVDKKRGEGSLELSLDEVVDLANKIGFEIKVRMRRQDPSNVTTHSQAVR